MIRQLLGFVRDALRELPSRPEFQESFLEACQATVAAHASHPPKSGVADQVKVSNDIAVVRETKHADGSVTYQQEVSARTG